MSSVGGAPNCGFVRLSSIYGLIAALTACSTSAPQTAVGVSSAEIATRINEGMQRLGASSARGECFANRISGSLDYEAAAEAASLIEKSDSKEVMRDNVIAARAPVGQAFVRAHFGCSLSR